MKKNNNDNFKILKSYSSNKKYNINAKDNIKEEIFINNLKCPICNKICLININKEKLSISIKCNNINCSYQQNDIIHQNNKKNDKYLSKSDIFCPRHNLAFHSYCFYCKKNICEVCIKDHLQHNKIELSTIKPNDNEAFKYKLKIKEKNEVIHNIINNIIEWKREFENLINIFIKVITNIYNLEDFIIMNYEPKNNNQNYNYIENYNYIKGLDFKIPELEQFNESLDWKEKGQLLINIINEYKNILNSNENNIEVIQGINYKENNRYFFPEKYDTNNNINSNRTERKYFSKIKSIKMKEKFINNFLYTNGLRKSNDQKNYVKKANKINNISNVNGLINIKKTESLGKKINDNDKLRSDKNLKKKNQVKNNESNYQLLNSIIIEDCNLNNIDNNTENNIILSIKNIDNNTTANAGIETNVNNDNKISFNDKNNILNDNDTLNDARIEKIPNEKISIITKIFTDEIKNQINQQKIELKHELVEIDRIKSIEILNDNRILICTKKVLNIYKINLDYELNIEYFINNFNGKINYATQLSNGNLIICFTNFINIIKIIQEDKALFNRYLNIQELKLKNDSFNINKVIEIKNKNYLITCDKNYIIKYSKDNSSNIYKEVDFIKINEKIKCIEYINEKYFVAVQPEKQIITFYDIENLNNNNNIILEKISSVYGRYIISNVEKYKCVFVGGIKGIYLISTEKYLLISFVKLDEWISSISYDYINDCLICGSLNLNKINNNKSYNLIVFSIENENKHLDNINIIEEGRINGVHKNDIMAIKSLLQEYIITGSNDKTIKLWKYA